MNRFQLAIFFRFVNIPYSEERESIYDLKKILLLESKASETLYINFRAWTKNDLLIFFESEFDSFDYHQLKNDFPWVEQFEDLETIQYTNQIEIVVDERIVLFFNQLHESLMNSVVDCIAVENFNSIAGLLHYKSCFSEELQVRFEKKISVEMTKFLVALTQMEVVERSNLIFYQSSDYYLLLALLNDKDLMLLNIETFKCFFHHFSLLEAHQILTQQKKLKHNPSGQVVVASIDSKLSNKSLLNAVKNMKKITSPDEYETLPSTTSEKIIGYIVIAAVIALIVWKCS